jgi:GT2 family glycosyltransferase
MASVTLCLVTHGRPEIVTESFRNVMNTGLVSEVVWVDNCSPRLDYLHLRDCVLTTFPEPVQELHLDANRGVAWALNRSFAIASGSHLLVTDGDIAFPDGGLQDMCDVLAAEPSRVACSMYVVPPETKPERFTGDAWTETLRSGRTVTLRQGLPMIASLFSRECLTVGGYVHEGFGLCRWDDVEKALRWRKWLGERGLSCVAITSALATHLPDLPQYQEPEAYRAAKQPETDDPRKVALWRACEAAGYPIVRPF